VTLSDSILAYSAGMLALVALSSWLLARRPSWLRFLVLGAVLAVAAIVGARYIAPGPEVFRALHLLAYGVFGAGPIYLLAAAWIARQALPRLVAASLAGVALIALVGIDAFWIEPYWLEITRHEIVTDKIDQPLRIAVVADFQTDHFAQYQRDSLRAVMDAKPDLILMPGDYIQGARIPWDELRDQFNAFLHEIDFGAPLGVVAVQGNTDAPKWPSIFAGLPVHTIIDNETVPLGPVTVTGLHEWQGFQDDTVVEPRPGFHIVVAHSPNFALGDIAADLLVAGHVHGGQVRIPFFGPPITFTSVPRDWAVGFTSLPGNRTLAVSRGVGMERHEAPRLRFLCRPELMLIDLVPAKP